MQKNKNKNQYISNESWSFLVKRCFHLFSFVLPASITKTTSGIVIPVSAILVAKTICKRNRRERKGLFYEHEQKLRSKTTDSNYAYNVFVTFTFLLIK